MRLFNITILNIQIQVCLIWNVKYPLLAFSFGSAHVVVGYSGKQYPRPLKDKVIVIFMPNFI